MNSNPYKSVRVAAVQYAVGPDVDANLATTLRMLDAAAECQPADILLQRRACAVSWPGWHQHQVQPRIERPQP